jgi:hypothetical protein
MFRIVASAKMFACGDDQFRALTCTPDQLEYAREICQSMSGQDRTLSLRECDRIIGAAVLLVSVWCDRRTYTAEEGARVVAKKIGECWWDGPVPQGADYTLDEFHDACQTLADQALFIRRALGLHRDAEESVR